MIITHLIFVLATAYVALVLGSLIKMLQYQVHGISLLLSVFSPLLLLIMPILLMGLFLSPKFVELFKVPDHSKLKKPHQFFVLALITVESFPFVVTLASVTLALFVESAKKIDWYGAATRYFKDRLRTENLIIVDEGAH